LSKRRTHPSYLSDGEAAREMARTKEMVDGFSRFKPVINVGKTKNFVVDFDRKEGLILIYGKEIQEGCPFKLAFNENETKAIIDLLAKTKDYFAEIYPERQDC
jgi:hypothetical protein